MNKANEIVKSSFKLHVAIACVLSVVLAVAPAHATEDDGYHDCLIEPNVVTSVGSPVQGVLAELLVDRGDYIKRGQPIARLEATTELARLEHASARAAMESEIAARSADLRLAKINLQRQSELKKQGLAPAQKYDEAIARRDVSLASLNQAKESLELLHLEKNQAERRVDERTLKSPVDGVVVEQHSFPGEFVYDNPVMTIAEIDPLRVEVVLPARLFSSFKRGDVDVIEPELPHAKTLRASVDVIDRVLDTRSGTFGIRLVLLNEDMAIPGGQKCRLHFETQISEVVQ